MRGWGDLAAHGDAKLAGGDGRDGLRAAQVEARLGGNDEWLKGKISKVRDDGTYDILYDDGDKEKNVEARLIRRLPLSPLDIAQENGHAAIVALLEEHQK